MPHPVGTASKGPLHFLCALVHLKALAGLHPPAQVRAMKLEYQGAPLKMEPKSEYVQRVKVGSASSSHM